MAKKKVDEKKHAPKVTVPEDPAIMASAIPVNDRVRIRRLDPLNIAIERYHVTEKGVETWLAEAVRGLSASLVKAHGHKLPRPTP